MPRASFLALAAVILLSACGSGPAEAPNPTRALDERRAVQVIITAFRGQRDQPVRGPKVQIRDGVFLEVDVLASGHKYGVAYTTPKERADLGAALPARDEAMGDALQLINGIGDDTGSKILVLRDTDYMYDDHVGSGHEDTTITAENMLKRDVTDFVVKAHSEKWP